jgi:predicted dehydrogenase
MIIDWSRVKIFVRPGVTDFRKQINGLSVIVQEELSCDVFSGNLFLFSNRRRTHLQAYSHPPNVEIAAVCTRGSAAASLISDRASVFTDSAEMISTGCFDAVDICFPTRLHADADAVAAGLDGGHHVLCEKPLAPNLKECDRVIAASNRSKCTLAVAHCLRYWPAYAAAKRLIDSGQYGRILHAELSRVSPTPIGPPIAGSSIRPNPAVRRSTSTFTTRT